MSKLIHSLIFFALVMPVLTLAQTDEETPEANAVEGEFSESIEIAGGFLHYVAGENGEAVLAESWHDTTGDGLIDAWFVYENDTVVQESYDTTGDEQPDIIVVVDAAGQVQEMRGDAATAHKVPEPNRFVPEPIEIDYGTDEDLVGDLSNLSIDEPDNNWIFFVLMFLVGGVIYLFWQRQQ